MRRRLPVLVLAVGFFSWPGWAQPSDSKLRCIQDHIDGQRARNAGRLLGAREPLERCSKELCPPAVREECGVLLTSLDAATPSLLVELRDGAGASLEEGRLWLDERRVERWAKDRPIPLDPGAHRLVAEGSWGRVELPVSLAEGEKSRRVTLVLPAVQVSQEGASGGVAVASSSPPPTTPTRQASPRVALAPGAAPLVVGLGATSAVAVGVFSVFALKGRATQRDMEERCAPFCPPDQLRAMKTDYLVADIALGVAVLAGGAALGVYLGKQQVVLDARGVTLRGAF